jgi:hypothetical protein
MNKQIIIEELLKDEDFKERLFDHINTVYSPGDVFVKEVLIEHAKANYFVDEMCHENDLHSWASDNGYSMERSI